MKNNLVMRKAYVWIAALLSIIMMIPAVSVSAASVTVTTATDGRNTLALSQSGITGVTFSDSAITIAGSASPAGSEVAIIAYLDGSDSDDDVVYMGQATSNASTGAYKFNFGFESIKAGVYRIDVGVQGSSTMQTRYFQLVETLPPEGGKDVFAHLSVGGQAVSFDSDLCATVEVSSKNIPAVDAISANSNIKLITAPPVSVPGKAVIAAKLADGTVKTYTVIVNFKPNNTAVNLKYKNSESGAYNNGGADKNYLNYNLGAISNSDTPYRILFEEGIKFGTSADNATLAYGDRTNVWFTGGSEVLKDAVILRSRKDDGGTTLARGEFFTNTYNGVGNNPAWMSFDVNADATVYVFDRYGEVYTQTEWPALVNLGFSKNPGLYIKGTATGASGDYVYYKKFKAGETVKIPSYGRPGKWANASSDSVIPYDPPVYAIMWDSEAETYTESKAPTVSVSSATAAAGGSATVTVSIKNNPGFVSMMLDVGYDSRMTLTNVSDTGVLSGALHSDNLKLNPYRLCWDNDLAPSNIRVNGDLVNLTFKVPADLAPGTYPVTVSYDFSDYFIFDFDFAPVYFETVDAFITVEAASVMKGDVNSDGRINALDRAFISRFIAKWESNQTLPSEEAADVNDDGRINALDRAFISRFIAKWDGYDL